MGTEGAPRRRLPPRLAARVDGARRFRAAAREALADLPPELAERMDNVDVIVRGRPTTAELRMAGVPRGGTLLGLYHGTPLTYRTAGYNMTLPDRIYLFRQPLEAMCRTDDDLVRQIRRTVIHEVAHHFGISDARLHELGAY